MKHLHIKPNYTMEWTTATDYCHHGIPLSNGVFGALIWFNENKIMLTVNRADYWDHRGGTEWTKDCTFPHLKDFLEQGSFEEAKLLFKKSEFNGKMINPSRLPMGRFELELAEGVTIQKASLDLLQAEVKISCIKGDLTYDILITILIDQPTLALFYDSDLIKKVGMRPAYEFPAVQKYYDQFGIAPHRNIEKEDFIGWVQELPEDPACAVVARHEKQLLLITSIYGKQYEQAIDGALAAVHALQGMTYENIVQPTREQWSYLWNKTADIEIPDQEITTMYYLGIFKMLGNSMPGGIAPTLQGPWVEEHRIAPWNGDYHFNINVQECLWPAYASNHLDSLKPLFQMIDKWKPILAARAKSFVGEEDGYQLNHACDDQGTAIAGFWTGAIDHANTSWIAQMMWQYAVYAQDHTFLLEEAYPFMMKTLNVFVRMMELDGKHYRLPVTVSPEYGGAGNDAWGVNSTFFLTNIHFLCEKILLTAEQFSIHENDLDRVRDIQSKLPRLTTGLGKLGEEIYLWEGQPLEESHRHHSHLACIYPFDTIDLKDEKYQEIIQNSYITWVKTGMGQWTGWSMPWASILHGRFGSKDMAYFCLKVLQDVFTMKGHSTRHDANYNGFTFFSDGDIMQVEAGIAASAAVLEMYVQCVQGTIRLFPALPDRFENASFDGVRTEGAFLISASRQMGRIKDVHIYSEKGGELKLVNPFSGKAVVENDRFHAVIDSTIIKVETIAGETIVIHSSNAAAVLD